MTKQANIIRIATLGIEEESSLPLICAEFDREHISYQIRDHHDSAYDGVFMGQKGLADVYVYQKDADRAQLILKNLQSK
jgi:hypothetical protein